MAEIFGYPIMGGGSDLNFKVISVASESALPSSAAENTIAVITTTAITSYVFSSTAPTSPTEGMVWFATGTASGVGINAIKRNGLWVYPAGCQQYVSGTWVSKTAKTYTSGAWAGMEIYLYNAGDQCVGITGGWTTIPAQQTNASGWGFAGNSTVTDVSFNADSIYIFGQTKINDTLTAPAARTRNPVDLTGISTLTVKCAANTHKFLVGAYLPGQTIYPMYNALARTYVNAGAVTGTLDVSAVNQDAVIIVGLVAYKEGGIDEGSVNILSLKGEH